MSGKRALISLALIFIFALGLGIGLSAQTASAGPQCNCKYYCPTTGGLVFGTRQGNECSYWFTCFPCDPY